MKTKNIAIVALIMIVAALLVVILNLKRANDLSKYAMANNCKWVATGTMYGDNRDYICKKGE